MLVYDHLSNLLRQIFLLLPLVHVEFGTHHVTKQRSDYLESYIYAY